jgi:hypothetical protein
MKRWKLVQAEELSYLRGIEKGARKLQRARAKSRTWDEVHQRKLTRLREQIECDQEYIDALEEAVSPEDLKRIRRDTQELRRRRATL